MVQYDDRDLATYNPALNTIRERNERLSTQHPKFTYSFYTKSELPPWWVKVQVVKDKLTEIPEGDYVLWLDTDACIDKYDELHALVASSVMTIASSSKPNWSCRIFNAGVWCIRNCDTGKAIMECWFDLFYPEFFRRDETGEWKWLHKYAGWSFEQGAFSLNVYDKFKEHINKVCWTWIQNRFPDIPEHTLVHHFSRDKHEPILEYIANLK